MIGPVEKRIQRIIDQVEQAPELETIDLQAEFSDYDPDFIDRIQHKIERDCGFRMPDELGEFVHLPSHNNIHLCWKYRGSDDPELFGEFMLHPLSTLKMQNTKVHQPADLDPQTAALFSSAHRFDDLPIRDYMAGTVLIPQTDAPPKLYYMDKRSMLPMELVLDDYLDALETTWGVMYWQLLYCTPEIFEQAELYKREILAKGIAALENIMEEQAWSQMNRRLTERG